MDNLRVMVTGAGGYIGRHVVKGLLDGGCAVTAVVRPGSKAQIDNRATVVEADILGPEFDVKSVAAELPDVLVHLAWQDGFSHNATSHMELLSAHFAFLASAVTAGVRRLAVLGTMHEVGYWEGPITAATPTSPTTLYGIAKDALRRAVAVAFNSAASVVWLRCFYILGDDRNNNSIFTRILEAHDRGDSTFPFTTGKTKYDFIDVDALAQQISAVAVDAELTGVINCCSGEPQTLAARVEEFILTNQLNIKLDYGAFPDRPYDSPGVWGDATAIRQIMSSR
jgi:dTDP-6-deoxy-L-talose 4-dehydrogenase (NAD+)